MPKLQSISKDWIMPTAVEQREIWKVHFILCCIVGRNGPFSHFGFAFLKHQCYNTAQDDLPTYTQVSAVGWSSGCLFGCLDVWLVGCLVDLFLLSTQKCRPLFLPKLLYPAISLTLSHIRRPHLSTIPAHEPTIHNKYIPNISDYRRRNRARKGAP